jgi:hypothetical protein
MAPTSRIARENHPAILSIGCWSKGFEKAEEL